MTESDHLPLTGLDATPVPEPVLERLAAFATRWWQRTGNEQQLAQSFLLDLCDALGTAKPNDGTVPPEAYQFERPVEVSPTERGRIDLYKQGCFVLEAKCGKLRHEPGAQKVRGTKAYRRYIEAAFRDQALVYASRLPEGEPPLVIVVDVGWSFWIWRRYAGSYGGFHSPRRITIPLDRLADEDHARILLACFEDPASLDPGQEQERVTREAAEKLAELAAALGKRFEPEPVARFLMRCLFCMFAEDADLLDANSFTELLLQATRHPDAFAPELSAFFRTMDEGGSFHFHTVRRFNGALFHDATALPLARDEIKLLAEAAALRWDRVDPSIFGTLLERALDPAERKRLGAHYTPRAYVERLVRPTLGEPLRRAWEVAQLRADELLDDEGAAPEVRTQRAAAVLRGFLDELAHLRVLDPACGTGNFLYVSYALVKELEHEALERLRELGVGAQQALGVEGGLGVVPSHFLGLEVKPWATEIAQLVLWIGHLQWEISHRRRAVLPEPILGEERSIACRDALITWTGTSARRDAEGRPVLRWDRRRTVTSPVTGADVPDPDALVTDEVYEGVARAAWPRADFIVGNPPFLGNKTMREHLGDGYVEAVRGAYPEVAETVDFVMYWWHRAAEEVRAGRARRFGLITTNSLRQTFNRQVTAYHLEAEPPLGLAAAIADHPWVDEKGSAAVRIAMTVGEAGDPGQAHPARLGRVVADGDEPDAVVVRWQTVERIHADLSAGADVTSAVPLKANEGLSFQGMNLVGKGFRVSDDDIRAMGYDPDDPPPVIRPYLNAREMMQTRHHRKVIDAYGLTAEELGDRYPPAYQWLFDRVKPERDHNRRASRRERWWLFGETVGKLRAALVGLERMIITPETSKHRVFEFAPVEVVPDHKLYAIALDDAFALGVLSSRVHTTWAPRAGGRQGVGNDPTYNNTRCFLRFPFPDPPPALRASIAGLAEELDAWRKAARRRHPDATLTTLYNLLDTVRAGGRLTSKERALHTAIATDRLRQLHDALDAAVLDAYGWERDLDEDALLVRLVALNHERAAEEAAGRVRWLRAPEKEAPPAPGELIPAPAVAQAGPGARRPWPPADAPAEQLLAVLEVLEEATGAMTAEDVAGRFTRAPRGRVADILERLASRRLATVDAGRYRRAGA